MSRSGYIPLKEKLAAALAQMLRDDGSGKLVPVIPYPDAKMMTADQVLSLFHFDHYPVRKTDGGPDKHFNLVPRFIREHREKTATIDVPQIRKADRLSRRADDAAVNRLLARDAGEPQRSRWPSRKIPSRSFQKAAR